METVTLILSIFSPSILNPQILQICNRYLNERTLLLSNEASTSVEMSRPSDSGNCIHRPHREGPSRLRPILSGLRTRCHNIPLSRAVVVDIIHHLDREPTALPSTGGTDNLGRLQFLLRYGDYAGRVWNDLKVKFGRTLRSQQATGAINLLREELGVLGSSPCTPCSAILADRAADAAIP
ncbi:hypothetical protein GGR51DRAFT_517810 [Nemania sp. FL0031]|nr:hypothetical protein GGR51DRAFT_517810 [Nemania sp. FL0031]